jgi:hypothetical protein
MSWIIIWNDIHHILPGISNAFFSFFCPLQNWFCLPVSKSQKKKKKQVLEQAHSEVEATRLKIEEHHRVGLHSLEDSRRKQKIYEEDSNLNYHTEMISGNSNS